MKKFLFQTLSMICLVIAMASCSSSSSDLLGKWEQDVDQQGIKAHITYTFEPNNQLSQTIIMTGTTPKVDIEGAGHCTYTYADGEIKFKFSGKDFDFSKFEMEGVPAELMELAIEQTKSQMVDMEQSITNVEINGDTLTGTLNGQKITLKRA